MRRYGIRSAILTMLHFWRDSLKTREAVIQQHVDARKVQLKKENEKNITVKRILSEDLESLYSHNPKCQPEAEHAYIFLTKKLTDEETTLLEKRNRDYLKMFSYYRSDPHPHYFDNSMKEIRKSSDPESIFSRSYGFRITLALHVTLESIEEEMRKRVANEDLSNMEFKRQRVK